MICNKARHVLVSVITFGSLAISYPGYSQDYGGKVRAVNLARNTAIALNGGIGKYAPDKCMFDSSTPLGLCWIREDQNGYLFQFVGGPPGWQVTGMRPTTQTSIIISVDGRSVVSIDYNAPFQ